MSGERKFVYFANGITESFATSTRMFLSKESLKFKLEDHIRAQLEKFYLDEA
jgi:hypothetical protein